MLEEDEQNHTNPDNLTVEKCIELLSTQPSVELDGHINGVDNVARFIDESDLLNGGGIFAEFANTHFVLLRYNHTGSNDWQTQLFYKGTVPAVYQ
jgi:hypothetical protein